jgi:hypothetical protein
MNESIYSRDHLCPELKPGKKCFVVQQYGNGACSVVFHEHVPSHRISQESELAVLHDLALHYSGYSAVSILHSRLNGRRGGPLRFPVFPHHVSYPEEGVLRHSLTCTSASVWLDSVISRKVSRRKNAV